MENSVKELIDGWSQLNRDLANALRQARGSYRFYHDGPWHRGPPDVRGPYYRSIGRRYLYFVNLYRHFHQLLFAGNTTSTAHRFGRSNRSMLISLSICINHFISYRDLCRRINIRESFKPVATSPVSLRGCDGWFTKQYVNFVIRPVSTISSTTLHRRSHSWWFECYPNTYGTISIWADVESESICRGESEYSWRTSRYVQLLHCIEIIPNIPLQSRSKLKMKKNSIQSPWVRNEGVRFAYNFCQLVFTKLENARLLSYHQSLLIQ